MVRMLPENLVKRLREGYRLLGPLTSLEGDDLPPGAEDAEVLLTMSSIKTSRALIDALPNLRLVICYGSGIEFVDRDYLQQRGIALTNAAGANASSVAEFAMGLILAGSRHILTGDRFLRTGRWKGNSVERYPLLPGLQGAKLGIYGLGEIGRQIARRAEAFDMRIGYHSRSRKPGGYHYLESLAQLAAWADILVVAARGTAQNYHAIDADILKLLGPQGHLINVARGMLVDENALCDALETGQLAGAALDVFESEPRVSERLLSMNNLILTPHLAAGTHSAQAAQQQRMLDNVGLYFSGGELIGRVC
ncbi:2-hydroxyacid dehydrogenase [Brenneria sp. 4F2]|nr:2-hydroxyacid dehydrogenase [Brenneria bubanii]